MPTGYTAMIEDNPTMTAREWVMRGLVQAFMVYDGELEWTEEQVEKEITSRKDYNVTYYEKELKKSFKEREKLNAFNEINWEVYWTRSEYKKKIKNEESKAKSKLMQERHEQIMKDMVFLKANAKTELTRNIAKYGIEQLNTVAYECKPYIEEPETLAQYKSDRLAENSRDIQYYTTELTKAIKNKKETIERYISLKEEVNSILGDKNKTMESLLD
jgi:hypothetical protein